MKTLYSQIKAESARLHRPTCFATDITHHDRAILGAGIDPAMDPESQPFYRNREPIPVALTPPLPVTAGRSGSKPAEFAGSQKETKMYTTYGDVRGGCGHQHKTIETAEACLGRDQEGCAKSRGYSDRRVAEIDDAGRLYDHEAGGIAEDAWIPGPGGRTSGAARF